MKIVVATEKPFAPVAIEKIREVISSAGYHFILLENYKDVSELTSVITDADGLIVRSDRVTEEILNEARKLRIVVRAGAGYDNLDLAACTAHNVVAMNTPGQNSNAVAELAFEMMLYQARSGFSGRSGSELRGKRIGLHAFGNVSRYMAEIAKGFGMEIFAFDPFVDETEMRKSGVIKCAAVEDLYKSCQYVSLHIPANENTRKSISYRVLNMMPQNAVLVNTARKEVIDEEGLLRIFEEKPDFVYLADVAPDARTIFEEKYSGRFIFTDKKMGAQTEEANINAGVAAARQVVGFFKTGDERFRVNK